VQNERNLRITSAAETKA